MKIFSSQKKTIEAFVNNECNNGKSNDGRVWFEDNVIYSFGRHFPLAVRFDNGFFAINDTKYSMNTRKHQNIIKALTSGVHVNIVMPTRETKLEDFLNMVDSLL